MSAVYRGLCMKCGTKLEAVLTRTGGRMISPPLLHTACSTCFPVVGVQLPYVGTVEEQEDDPTPDEKENPQ